MIASNASLTKFLNEISSVPHIALDTEADSLYCYSEKLCLIQISIESDTVLVDPLSKVDLRLLFKGIFNKRVIFHGGDYDLRLLARYGEFKPYEIFDTMIAARLLGYHRLGLAALVEHFFSVKLSKVAQRANWALRPLTQQMIVYAINDTKFLLPLARILEADIIRLGRQEWLRQSLERMLYSARTRKSKDFTKAWRITGSSALPPNAQAILQELWNWREEEARECNRPPFYIMRDEAMLKIAEAAIKDIQPPIPKFSSSRRKRFTEMLSNARKIPEDCWPVQKKERSSRHYPSKHAVKEFLRLKNFRDEIAKKEKIDPSIIASKGSLELVAFQRDFSDLMDWQRHLLRL